MFFKGYEGEDVMGEMNKAPFCLGGEKYCFSFMKKGSVACEDCEYNSKTFGVENI